jgi:ubiquinone/menaquinone biosynthesis C-methylase UbiE
MKMSRLEKRFVNSLKQGKKNLEVAQRLFERIDLGNVHEALEVGCGVGFLASHLAEEHGLDVTGIDLDPDQVARAREQSRESDHLRFLEGDATELPFENERFDMVLSFDVLHHIPNWEKALNEVSRVLRSGGMYVLNDLALPSFTANTLGDLLKNRMGAYSIDEMIGGLKRNHLLALYLERPTVNLLMRHFSVVSRRLGGV